VLKTSLAVATSIVVLANGQSDARPLSNVEKRIIMGSYSASLKDPSSAQYLWSPLIINRSVKGRELPYCFRVNGKNSYGAYTGFRTIAGQVTYNGGAVTGYSYVAGSRDDRIIAQATNDICRAFGYTF
jgi:hypothetical protein